MLGAAAAHATPRSARSPSPRRPPALRLEGYGRPAGTRRVSRGAAAQWGGEEGGGHEADVGVGLREVVGAWGGVWWVAFWELPRGFVFWLEVCNNGYMPGKAPDKRTMRTQQRN